MNDFRAASQQSWSSVAPDWGELVGLVDRQLELAARWMIAAVEPAPGDRVLELAGGPGTLSLIAARAVGPEGRVVHSDFAAPMVDVARRRLAAEGAGNVECRVIDAEAIDLPDGSVDVVLCRMGYMLMADPAAALRETARVLMPGGRVAFAVWSEASANPWGAAPMMAILGELGAPPPPAGGPGLWALADEEQLGRLVEDAGLESIRMERLDDHVMYDSPGQWLAVTTRLAGPIRTLVEGLGADARAAVEERLAESAKPFETEDGTLAVPERMLAVSARRSLDAA